MKDNIDGSLTVVFDYELCLVWFANCYKVRRGSIRYVDVEQFLEFWVVVLC